MERLKRSFSFRKKKGHVPESHKPHQWQEDERKVREGTCSFQVRYLGCIEVFESRGIQVCEEAVKALKSKNHRSMWSRMSIRRKKKKGDSQQCKGKYQRAILYVSGDALRVVDEISKGLIVDQTIEKVSFCAPDRNQEKGFAYICRDGTTRRWMCHGFLAVKETVCGERLSHAVGCAFAICLERKQKREKESVTVTFNDKGTSFTRTGSFRQTTMTERLADPQSAIVAEPIPMTPQENPHAVQRPHATVDMLQRQSSFRGFEKLGDSSPFKRQLSLRMNELPSTLERQKQFGYVNMVNGGTGTVATIPEASPTREQEEEENISEMCQQLTQGLSALATTDDPFASAPNSAALVAATQQHNNPGSSNIPAGVDQPVSTSNNPWGPPTGQISDAEFWLNTATSIAKQPQAGTVTTTTAMVSSPVTTTVAVVNGTMQVSETLAVQQTSPWPTAATASPVQQPSLVQRTPPPVQQPSLVQRTPPPVQHPSLVQRAPHLQQQTGRSHSFDAADMWQQQQQKKAPSLRELSARNQFLASQNTGPATAPAPEWSSVEGHNSSSTATETFDPFDAAWEAKANANHSFQAGEPGVTKTFEVNL